MVEMELKVEAMRRRSYLISRRQTVWKTMVVQLWTAICEVPMLLGRIIHFLLPRL